MAVRFFDRNMEALLIEAHYEGTSAFLTREILNVQQQTRVIQEMNKMKPTLGLEL